MGAYVFLSRTYAKFDDGIRKIRHPLLFAFVIGMVIRLLLIPFTTTDTWGWMKSSDNIVSDIGLYGREGYYYGPAFGYLLSLGVMFGTQVLGIGVFGTQVDQLAAIQLQFPFELDVATFGFQFMFKLPMYIGDILLSYLVYYIVKEKTEDDNKAALAFAMMFLCPLLIFESSVHGMFDCYMGLLALLSIYMLSKKKYFFAGLAWGLGTLLKIFPAYLFPILVAYVIVENRESIKAYASKLAVAMCGAVTSFVMLYYPTFFDGTFIRSWNFIFDRAAKAESISSNGGGFFENLFAYSYLIGITVQVIAAIFAFYLMFRFIKSKESDKDRLLLMVGTLAIAASFLWIPMPEYLILILPLILVYALVYDRKYINPFMYISIGSAFFIMMVEGPGALIPLAAYTDIISLDTVNNLVLGYTTWPFKLGNFGFLQVVFCTIGAFFQLFGTVLLFLYRFKPYRAGEDPI